jgi:hypothetical protein
LPMRRKDSPVRGKHNHEVSSMRISDSKQKHEVSSMRKPDLPGSGQHNHEVSSMRRWDYKQ